MALITRKCKKAHISATPEHPKTRVLNIWILILYTWWVSNSFTSNSKTNLSFIYKSSARISPTKWWRWLNCWHLVSSLKSVF